MREVRSRYCLVVNCLVVGHQCFDMTTLGRTSEHLVTMPSTRTTELSSAEPSWRGETWCAPNEPTTPMRNSLAAPCGGMGQRAVVAGGAWVGVPPLQRVMLTLNATTGWVYIYALQKNISITGGMGSLIMDPASHSVFASAGSPPNPPQSVRLDGLTGTRTFTNILNTSVQPPTAHDSVYLANQTITNPLDNAFCNWINPRPCTWAQVRCSSYTVQTCSVVGTRLVVGH